ECSWEIASAAEPFRPNPRQPRLLSSRLVAAGFLRMDGELTCDGASLSELAREHGTPLYVYSGATIEENFRRFDQAFAPVDHLVCYATKANSSLAIVSRLAEIGAGADVVSG